MRIQKRIQAYTYTLSAEVRVVRIDVQRVHSLLRFHRQSQFLQAGEVFVPRVLEAFMRWVFADHLVAFPAHGGVGDALQVHGRLQLLQFVAQRCGHVQQLIQPHGIDAG